MCPATWYTMVCTTLYTLQACHVIYHIIPRTHGARPSPLPPLPPPPTAARSLCSPSQAKFILFYIGECLFAQKIFKMFTVLYRSTGHSPLLLPKIQFLLLSPKMKQALLLLLPKM